MTTKTKSPAAIKAQELRSQGFDKTHVDRSSGNVRFGCSQCQAMAVNGVAIHERGCPNEKYDN